MVAEGIPSSQLMEGLRREPLLAQRLESDAVKYVVELHMTMHDLVNQQCPLRSTLTAHSDNSGVYCMRSKASTADQDKQQIMLVQALTGSEPIDWAHHTFGASPTYFYSKSSVFTADDCLTPHLELEMGVGGDGSKVLLYMNMDPRLSLTLHPQYLDHYYSTSPPGCSRTWQQLEQEASTQPGFTRFTSNSFHVRQFSATCILFHVEINPQSCAAAKHIVIEAAKVWLAWLAAGGSNRAASAEAIKAAAGPAAVPSDAAFNRQFLQEMAERSWAWRRFPRREYAVSALKATFGNDAVLKYWDSMAGEHHVRQLSDIQSNIPSLQAQGS
eukprot:GHRR01003161.1.p1 GENE.GHRR01003161.1~~GHRR01003161.1.p1  ORF type:complete len:328 (+),score=89.42 GHRR01003161.1:706-1689(+)